MSGLIKINTVLQTPEQIGGFILENYGIRAKINYIYGKPAIKVDHHISLFTLINKIRTDFDFTVYHKKNTNEYIIYFNV